MTATAMCLIPQTWLRSNATVQHLADVIGHGTSKPVIHHKDCRHDHYDRCTF